MAKSKFIQATQDCPCQSGKKFADCCERYISGQVRAPDAKALMRSRYTAYALEDKRYLENTWHPRSRPVIDFEQQEACKWLGLTILSHTQTDQTATVEFVARYKVHGRAHRLHEISKFECEEGQWLYVDGIFQE